MFRPFVGEVLEGIVAEVLSWGLQVEVGPVRIAIFSVAMPGHKYDAARNIWRLDEDEYSDQETTIVRLRVINMREDENGLYVMGSLEGESLGRVR
mmetsp:Transcript_28384/g.90822  ORF Transcript_28384/g.90822 Transcript_28384/m.90822 type:complete len:95 (-) Transcript_28384:219-503(-)